MRQATGHVAANFDRGMFWGFQDLAMLRFARGGTEEALKTLSAVVASLDQVVCDFDQVAD